METVLEMKDVSFLYKDRDVLKKNKNKGIENINLFVNKGEIISIIGLNGSGKTTTLKCILGLNKLNSGSIKVLGKDILKDEYSRKISEKISYLPEISYYPKNLKLIKVMNYYGELYSIPRNIREDKINKALEEFNLLEYKSVKLKKFSKGMLQKVGIAQALLNDPKIVFLDEPMSGLDPVSREQIIKILLKLKKSGTSIIFNTHLLEDVKMISDRAIFINKGKVIDSLDIKDRLKEDLSFSLKEFFLSKLGYSNI